LKKKSKILSQINEKRARVHARLLERVPAGVLA
jgi:hypothetical protein